MNWKAWVNLPDSTFKAGKPSSPDQQSKLASRFLIPAMVWGRTMASGETGAVNL